MSSHPYPRHPTSKDILVSIIIPVLNEADILPSRLPAICELLKHRSDIEIILCDGGSEDASLEIIAAHNCKLVQSATGRAKQMNTAAKVAKGRWLYFLHLDSSLPELCIEGIQNAIDWGFFKIALSGKPWIFRLIETAINLRSSLTHVAGGDQGLFFRKQFFDDIGGFSKIPLMEDIAISKKARSLSEAHIVQRVTISSTRRWEEKGVFKTILLMWSIRFAYYIGVSPTRLHKTYYPKQASQESPTIPKNNDAS